MKRLLVLAMLLVCASAAAASEFGAVQEGDRARLFLVMDRDYSADYAGIAVTRQTIGTCEDAVFVTDGTHAGFPRDYAIRNATSVRGLRYGDGIVMRGELQAFARTISGYTGYEVWVAPCQDGCQLVDFTSKDDPRVQMSWTGVVDIQGALNEMSDIPAPGPYVIESVEPAPDGSCAAVPTASMSFGGLNALYR